MSSAFVPPRPAPDDSGAGRAAPFTSAPTFGFQYDAPLFKLKPMDARPDLISDEALMLQYREGDVAAFETVYTRHKDKLYRFLLRQVDGAAQAEELCQEVWMNIIKQQQSYRADAPFVAYLFRIARHRLIDHYRRNARAISHSGPQPLQTPVAADLHEQTIAQDQWQRLQQAIVALPAEQREAFLLKQESGLSLDMIAQLTEVNSETVKSRLRYANQKLRQVLEDES